MASNPKNGVLFPTGGGAIGVFAAQSVGNIGLVAAGSGVSLGAVPMAGVGAIAGSAVYGAYRSLSDGDATAVGAIGLGALGGTGVYLSIGGVGLAGGFGAVGLGLGAMAGLGGVVGLGAYGAAKLLDQGPKESHAQVFARMEEKICWQEAYIEALLELELDRFLRDEKLKRDFLLLEAEDDMLRMKEELQRQKRFKANSGSLLLADSLTLSSASEAVWIKVHTLKHHTSLVNSIVINPNNQTVASSADDKTIVLWDLNTGNCLYTWAQPDIILSVAFSPDGKLLMGAGLNQVISSWKLDDKSLLDSFFKSGSLQSHDGMIYAIAISGDGKTLGSGSADHTIRVWRCEPGSKLEKFKRTLLGHSDTVLSVALTQDGATLVSGSIDKTVRIWNLTGWAAPLVLAGHSAPVNCVAIHPGEQFAASGSGDSTIRFWGLPTGQHLQTLEGHHDGISHLVFSADGSMLVSSSKDGTVKFWQVFSEGNGSLDPKHLWTLPGNGPIALSSNGNVLICSGDRGELRVWSKAPIRG